MFLTSIALLYDLGNQAIVTVRCENAKTFCLGHVSHESSVRYTFTAKELEVRCNTEVTSVWIRVLVFLCVFYELVVYGGAVYVCYYKPKTIDVDFGLIFQRCVGVTATITGLLLCLFVLLPLTTYILPSGGAGRWGVIAEMWASPFRGLVLLVLNIITAPLRWIFHHRLTTELGLDKVYKNCTCVEPIIENNLLKCPLELHMIPNMPELSNCESDLFCARDCLVAFPRIVINSLAFIFASLALFYRLLKLTHYITERETELDLISKEDERNTVSMKGYSCESQDRNFSECVLEEDARDCDMKEKSVGRSVRPKTAGFKKHEPEVYPRRNAVRKRVEIEENTQPPKSSSQNLDGAQSQQKTDDKFTENKEITHAKTCDVFDPEANLSRTTATNNSEVFGQERSNLDRSNGNTSHASSKILDLKRANLDSLSEKSLANGTEETECTEDQNTVLRKNTESKKSESKLLPRSKKHMVGFTEESAKKKGQSIGAGISQGKIKHVQGNSTKPSVSNGHLRKEVKFYRRTATNGVSEVKMGSTGDNDGSEEAEWSSSEDIVDGIEGLLVVEDESEFYMSGFRL